MSELNEEARERTMVNYIKKHPVGIVAIALSAAPLIGAVVLIIGAQIG